MWTASATFCSAGSEAMATSAEARPRTRNAWLRRSARWIGSLMMVAAVLAFAWVASVMLWQDPITAVYAKVSQDRLSSAYEERVREIQPTLVAAGSAKPVPLKPVAARFRKATTPGEAVGKLVIPRMGLSTIVVEGTDSTSLKKGPGVDERTHMPGEGELVYIAGHRTTFGAPFSNIDRLRPGDRVRLETPYATFDYRITGHVIVPATDLDRLKSRGREELALQACHPRFFATKRYIAYARLVAVRRPAAA